MNKANFDQDLSNQLESLNKDKQPERDLWQGIELALTQDEAGQTESKNKNKNKNKNMDGNKLYLLAATVAVFGFVGWLSMGQNSMSLTGDDLVAALSHQHHQQKNALLVKFQDFPALTVNWQEQVEELDQAAEAIKTALQNQPNNMALLKMLQSVHQQQIDLIERVHSSKWSKI
jgi:hypothetical protein